MVAAAGARGGRRDRAAARAAGAAPSALEPAVRQRRGLNRARGRDHSCRGGGGGAAPMCRPPRPPCKHARSGRRPPPRPEARWCAPHARLPAGGRCARGGGGGRRRARGSLWSPLSPLSPPSLPSPWSPSRPRAEPARSERSGDASGQNPQTGFLAGQSRHGKGSRRSGWGRERDRSHREVSAGPAGCRQVGSARGVPGMGWVTPR